MCDHKNLAYRQPKNLNKKSWNWTRVFGDVAVYRHYDQDRVLGRLRCTECGQFVSGNAYNLVRKNIKYYDN